MFDRPNVEIGVPVSRGVFEMLIAEDLMRVEDTIAEALDQAGIDSSEVDVVASTGGSSQLPAFQRMLAENFGVDKVRRRDPYSAIAFGLGLHARRIWNE